MEIILSVIIVEYHSKEEIKKCTESLQANLAFPYEVIVSSNSCYTEEEKNGIDTRTPNVRWIFNLRNGGFAYAMNEGLRVARGRYLAIMNSDCLLETPLHDMINFMNEHPEVGAIAPQMKDCKGNIQDTARPYVSLPRFLWRQAKRILGHKVSILDTKIDYTKIQTIDWLIGAFIMVSRSAYEATGGLDDRFFMYAEDVDWCARIRQQGFEIVYYPRAVIRYAGTRRARSKPKYAKIFINSHVAFWKKFGFFYGYPPRKHMTF